MTARRNAVTTYRRKGTFRAQHAEKTGRAAQRTALPPRCQDCRQPGTIAVPIDGITCFYCPEHVPLGE
jgi:hypothetical protein